jgi:hypothetical protein
MNIAEWPYDAPAQLRQVWRCPLCDEVLEFEQTHVVAEHEEWHRLLEQESLRSGARRIKRGSLRIVQQFSAISSLRGFERRPRREGILRHA